LQQGGDRDHEGEPGGTSRASKDWARSWA
jgi:hypothetical protein